MAGSGAVPATRRDSSPSESELAVGLAAGLSELPSQPFDQLPGPSDDATGTAAEPITMSTIHRMLAQVLEQTNALWRAQASNNRMLDELRRSMPAPQEYADIHERLRHVENLAETLAQGQRGSHPTPAQPSRGTGTTSSAHQGRASQGGPQPSIVRNVGGLPRCDDPTDSGSSPGLIMQTRESTHQTDCISPASVDQYPTLHIQEYDEVRLATFLLRKAHSPTSPKQTVGCPNLQSSGTNPLSGRTHHLVADIIVSSGQTRLPDTLPSIVVGGNSDDLLEIMDDFPPSKGTGYVSAEPVNTGVQDTSQVEHISTFSLVPRALDDSLTVPSGIEVPTPRPTSDNPGVVFIETEQNCQPEIACSFGDLAPEADNKRALSLTTENVPGVTDAEPDEPLHDQLADLATLIRRLLAHHEQEREDPGPKVARLQVINEIRQIYMEHKELLQIFLDAWKADSTGQIEEIVNAVRATANEQVPFNIEGYLDEFSRTLGIEIRMLLTEVGRLHEERQSLQREIRHLLTTRSALFPGGDFNADDRPPPDYFSPQAWPSPAGVPLPESPQPRPGWRAISSQGNRQASWSESPTASERPGWSWATWQPNPALAPTPPSVEPLLIQIPGSPGLFGPRSPRGSPRILPSGDDPQDTGSPVLFSAPSPRDAPRVLPTENEDSAASVTRNVWGPNPPLTGSPELDW